MANGSLEAKFFHLAFRFLGIVKVAKAWGFRNRNTFFSFFHKHYSEIFLEPRLRVRFT